MEAVFVLFFVRGTVQLARAISGCGFGTRRLCAPGVGLAAGKSKLELSFRSRFRTTGRYSRKLLVQDHQ
jgi:hypothetical protein